jgi:hypothetical protein
VRLALTLLGVVACGGKASQPTDAGADVQGSDGASCTYQDTRTTATRMCNVSADCVVVTREVDCCQTQYEGIRSDAAQKFASDQTALTSGCPGCGCAAQPVDDLGVKGNGSFVATCDTGVCTSHVQ